MLLGPDTAFNQEQIAKFSQADAQAFPRYEKLLEAVAQRLEPMLSRAAPDLLPLPAAWRSRSLGKKLGDTRQGWRLYRELSSLGERLPEAIELLTGAARPILQRWFESDVLRATLATDAVIGAFASISAPGTAYVLLHHVMGTAGGARGVWGYVEGGMGELAQSIWRTCEGLGVELVRECEVASIHKVAGQELVITDVTGNSYVAPCVASSVDAHLTFKQFLDGEELPDGFRQALKRIDYSSATTKINLAVSELPDFPMLAGHTGWTSAPRNDPYLRFDRLAGTRLRRRQIWSAQ